MDENRDLDAGPAAPAPWIAAQRRQLLAQRGHAWLLQGPSGLGQFELALELVRAWLCEQPHGDGACGRCPSCHAIDVHAHADLCVLMPEVQMLELGWPLPEKAQAEIDDKKRKPSREIRVEAMRDAVEFCQRTSARGRGKAVLVFPAEQMNAITANTLLKTLEEPPGDARFVLASEAAHQLLPTIRSRCLTHAMLWPTGEEALQWLAMTGGTEPEMQQLALQAAGGRPGDALALMGNGAALAQWPQLPRALAKGDVAALAQYSLPDAVGVLQKICHDLMALACGAAPRYFEPASLPAQPLAMDLLENWSRELVRQARTAEHPFNAGLMHEALAARAQAVLLSGRAARNAARAAREQPNP